MKMKSVMAGLYTAPPAHGPIISDSCTDTYVYTEAYNESAVYGTVRHPRSPIRPEI
jgi:hypothetical protein